MKVINKVEFQVNVEHVMQAVTQSMDKESLVKLAEQISKCVTENVIEFSMTP
jgi:hypothetical protein